MKLHEKLKKDAQYAKDNKLLLVLHCKRETVVGSPAEITEEYVELSDGWMGFQDVYGNPIKPKGDKHYKTVLLSSLQSIEFESKSAIANNVFNRKE
jgi:hypothetical protein